MFKGGTLLRVCYRRVWRFSEDLDFDWIHADDAKHRTHQTLRESQGGSLALDTLNQPVQVAAHNHDSQVEYQLV